MPTFLFTDLEQSTHLWETFGDRMKTWLAAHDGILKEEIERHGGRIIKTTGDGCFAVFEQESAHPVAAVLAIQRRMQATKWEAGAELRVRVALHAGEAAREGDDYLGPTVNRAARILEVGWGGQIVVSEAVKDAAVLPENGVIKSLGRHLLKDIGEPQMLFQVAAPDLPLRDFPPLRSLSGRHEVLPAETTPFVGRERERQELHALLDHPTCRVLTILGPGGMGKTRLAAKVAAERLEQYPDGVVFVALAPLASAELIAPAVAEALKLSVREQSSPEKFVEDYLREKQLLLVLDNFEHVMAGGTLVAALVEAAPLVQVVVTSRERLKFSYEQVFDLLGLEGYLATSAAAQLFLQSASRHDAHFQIKPEDQAALKGICEAVEGMPLALELAASWIRTLSLMEIEQEVRQSLDVLASSAPDRAVRHQSVRGVFEYSWTLLAAKERSALVSFSWFRGGWTLEAAKSVAGAEVPLLVSLQDKSLIHRMGDGRWTMHEVARQFAEEKLRQDAEGLTKADRAHRAHFGTWLAARTPALRGGPDTSRVADEVAMEYANLHRGWQSAVQAGDWATVRKYIDGLWRFFSLRARYQEGYNVFLDAWRRLEVEATRDLFVERYLLLALGLSAQKLGLIDQALTWGSSARDRFVAAEDRVGLARALALLGRVRTAQMETAAATSLLEEALELVGSEAKEIEEGNVLLALSVLQFQSGDFQAARQTLARAKEIFLAKDDRIKLTGILLNFAAIAQREGALEEAERLEREALKAFQELGDREAIARGLANLGGTLQLRGKSQEAQECQWRALNLFGELGNQQGMAGCHNNLGMIYGHLEEWEKMQSHLFKGFQLALASHAVQLLGYIFYEAGGWMLNIGEIDRGMSLLGFVESFEKFNGRCRDSSEKAAAYVLQGASPQEFSRLTVARELGRRWTLEEAIRMAKEEFEKDHSRDARPAPSFLQRMWMSVKSLSVRKSRP